MFYLIGLGLDEKSISLESLEILKECKKIYIEDYTVELPYDLESLEKSLKVKIFPITRMLVEGESFISDAKYSDTALLVYGSPLMATTHISLLLKCKKDKINYRVLENASIFDAVCESGLQAYKFGKVASMPKWTKSYSPDSFMDIYKENLSISAHTLLLVDIGLSYPESLKQLEKAADNKQLKINKVVVCTRLGTPNQKIYYNDLEELLGMEVLAPFCFILPGKLHFIESEALSELLEK
jgi:diphthine synthase